MFLSRGRRISDSAPRRAKLGCFLPLSGPKELALLRSSRVSSSAGKCVVESTYFASGEGVVICKLKAVLAIDLKAVVYARCFAKILKNPSPWPNLLRGYVQCYPLLCSILHVDIRSAIPMAVVKCGGHGDLVVFLALFARRPQVLRSCHLRILISLGLQDAQRQITSG